MSDRITPSGLIALKRQAKLLARSTGVTLSSALDQLARSAGFNNWSLLARSLKQKASMSSVLATSRHTVTLCGRLHERGGGIQRVWLERVASEYEEHRYAPFEWLPDELIFKSHHEAALREKLLTARRAIAFMDATGLQPSRAFVRIFRDRVYPRDVGFDHTCIWRDDNNRYIVTTEPYRRSKIADQIAAWCSEKGWTSSLLPAGVGIWNPCRDDCSLDCAGHTHMLVLAPSTNGGDAYDVARRIRQAPRMALVRATELLMDRSAEAKEIAGAPA